MYQINEAVFKRKNCNFQLISWPNIFILHFSLEKVNVIYANKIITEACVNFFAEFKKLSLY